MNIIKKDEGKQSILMIELGKNFSSSKSCVLHFCVREEIHSRIFFVSLSSLVRFIHMYVLFLLLNKIFISPLSPLIPRNRTKARQKTHMRRNAHIIIVFLLASLLDLSLFLLFQMLTMGECAQRISTTGNFNVIVGNK